MAELIVFLRSRELTRVPILTGEVIIGREDDCDVVIDNPGVSRAHAVVQFVDGAFRIRDLSRNGILINGREVESSALNFGDVVAINKFKIHFSPDGGVPVEMLQPPTRQVGNAPANVVATMTVDANAARKMQEEILRMKALKAAGGVAPKQPASSLNRVLGLALLLTLAAIGALLYLKQL